MRPSLHSLATRGLASDLLMAAVIGIAILAVVLTADAHKLDAAMAALMGRGG